MQTMFEESEARQAIAQNVADLMHLHGLTQTSLAQRAGVKQVFISRLLGRVMIPNAIDLANVADALGTTSDALMTSNVVNRKSKKVVKTA
jgi:transcriptional regulator with XRE-family HTH domain